MSERAVQSIVSKEQIKDAYILYLSGAAKWKVEGREIELDVKDGRFSSVSVEFVDGIKRAVVRVYQEVKGEEWLGATV